MLKLFLILQKNKKTVVHTSAKAETHQ